MKHFIILVTLLVLLGSCRKTDDGLVVSKIQKASKLATTEFTLSKVVVATKGKSLLWVIKLNEALFVANTQAVVKAGINLENLTKDDIQIDGQSIQIQLPYIEILNFSYPIDKVQIDSTITGNQFMNKFTLADYDRTLEEAELKIREVLPYLGIVDATKKKTRIMLETLLKGLGYTEIFLEFKDGLMFDGVILNPSATDTTIFDETPTETKKS